MLSLKGRHGIRIVSPVSTLFRCPMVAWMIGNGGIAFDVTVSGRIREVSPDRILPIACDAIMMRLRVGFPGLLDRNLRRLSRSRCCSQPLPRRQRFPLGLIPIQQVRAHQAHRRSRRRARRPTTRLLRLRHLVSRGEELKEMLELPTPVVSEKRGQMICLILAALIS